MNAQRLRVGEYSCLGTRTLKDTVNEALRLAAPARDRRVRKSLETLAKAKLLERSAAWR